jgi:uncharacterized protein YbaP (TraB family)
VHGIVDSLKPHGRGRASIRGNGLIAMLWVLATAAAAAPTATPATGPVILEELVVTGIQPGPGLWRVSRGDGEGEAWILATVTPLPRDMQWRTGEVEAILATADAVIAPAWVEVDIGAGDMFKMASLARSANAAIKLPDGERLEDRLPAEHYARWAVLKARHLPDDGKVERQRPLFASQTLYYEAISDAGLTRVDIAWKRISELAANRGLRVVEPTVHPPLDIDRKAYRAGIRALTESQVDDVGCFVATMDTLDLDLLHFIRTANAWAKGDVALLMPMQLATPMPPCKPVYDHAMSFQRRPEHRAQALAAWRTAVEAAILEGHTVLAVLPLADLMGAEGVVARLRAGGHEVEAPE